MLDQTKIRAILEEIIQSRELPLGDNDYFFRVSNSRGRAECYHIHIDDTDTFLDFYKSVAERYPDNQPIAPDEYKTLENGKIVIFKPVIHTHNENIYGYIEYFAL